MSEREIAIQLIALMAHVEGIAEEQKFVPPVEVSATDLDGQIWEFEYSPEWDSVGLLHVTPRLPMTLRLKDASGNSVETRITDSTLRPEWLKRFLH
jgi:hypothetical protein